MKITLENTSRFDTICGLQCRLWEGTTEKGVQVFAFIPVVAVATSAEQYDFENELREVKPKEPSAMAQYLDPRAVL